MVPLPSRGAKYLLGVQNRKFTPVSLLPLKIEEKNNKTIRVFAQIYLLQLGEGGQSKDLSPLERER